MLYTKDQINYHTSILKPIGGPKDYDLNNFKYVFYDGSFENDKLNGPGTLRLLGNGWVPEYILNRILMGTFKDN